jgi:hypothetical protein
VRTFELLLAAGPLAVYLILLGFVNLRRRSWVLTGSREIALVAVALSGLAIIGPMELFFPRTAANQFGPYIWLLLLVFYGLLIALWILLARPRLVVYNISATQLRAVLSELAHKLDPESRWAGDSLALPKLNVQLTVDSFDVMRNVSLVATSGEQDYAHWRRLERTLRGALREVEVPRNPRGYTLLVCGALVLIGLAFKTLENPQAVAQVFFQLLRP